LTEKRRNQLELNIAAGYNAESEVSTLLRKLFNGQDTTYRGADDKGIDQVIQFTNPIDKDELIYFGVQVKTGITDVEETNEEWVISKLKERDIRKYIKAHLPVILVYVRQEKKVEYYWKIITKDIKGKKVYIPKNSKLTPSAPYDLINYIKTKENQKNIKGTREYSKLVPSLNLTLRDFSKQYFKNKLLGTKIHNEILGDISVSWKFWRHITKKGRKSHLIYSALEILPAVKDEIQNSTSFDTYRRLKSFRRGNLDYQTRLLILKSNQVKFDDSIPQNITISIWECITYPSNWKDKLNIYPEVERKLILQSFFIKK
jgi:hypothetical protein